MYFKTVTFSTFYKVDRLALIKRGITGCHNLHLDGICVPASVLSGTTSINKLSVLEQKQSRFRHMAQVIKKTIRTFYIRNPETWFSDFRYNQKRRPVRHTKRERPVNVLVRRNQDESVIHKIKLSNFFQPNASN